MKQTNCILRLTREKTLNKQEKSNWLNYIALALCIIAMLFFVTIFVLSIGGMNSHRPY